MKRLKSLLLRLAKKTSSFLSDILRVFQTPFAGLPLVMWCYFVICYIALPHNQIWTGELPDSDDYTYLLQTFDWLSGGQSWFDNVQHRMAAPEGVAIHYTRFAQMPIAAVMLFYRLFHYTWRGAALLASFTLPLIYLGVFFTVLRVTAENFVSKNWSRLTAFIAMFASFLMFKFAPGQVDHHAPVLILIIAAMGLSAKVFAHPGHTRWALASSFVFALATAIGLEALPWMALTSAVIGLWVMAEGTRAARTGSAFGLGLFVFGSMFLMFDRPASQILDPDYLSYSIVYVTFMGGIAAALIGASAASYLHNLRLRFVIGGAFALILGLAFLNRYPALLAGPYGAMDPRLAALFFANLEEAVSLINRYTTFKAILVLIPPVLALGVSIARLRAAKDHKRWSWALLSAFLAVSLGLAVFYQIRLMIYAQLFSIIPLACLAERGWAWIGDHAEGRRRFWAEIWLVLLIGPLTSVFLLALLDGRSFNVGVLMFPAQSVSNSCDTRNIGVVLNGPPYFGRKLRLMNTIGEGSALLFATPHEVMAAPYHTNVRGNLDSLDFFSTTDAAKAKTIALRDGIDLVVMCRFIPDMYLAGPKPHYVTTPSGFVRMLPNDSFAGQLISHKVPKWLKEVLVPSPSNFSLFEVVKK